MILEMTNEKWQKLLCYKGFYDFVKDVGACETKSVTRPVIKYRKGKEYTKNEPAKNLQEKYQYLTIAKVMEFPNFESYAALIEVMEDEQDWTELKAIVRAILDMDNIKDYLSYNSSVSIRCKNINLFSCNKLNKPTTKKIKEKGKEYQIVINELENIDLWKFITSEYKGKKSLKGVLGMQPDGTEIKLSDYEWEFNIIFKVLTVPPYPEYRIIEQYAPKPKESESQDKSPRKLRADAVDSYVDTHMENGNLNDVLVKVCLVDAMYHAQLEKKANYETMAQHIIDFRTGDGATYLDALDSLKEYKWKDDVEKRKFIDSLIDHIRNVDYKNASAPKNNGVYSFATKYLHCHNKDFPIWDSNVNKIYKDWEKYYPNWNNSETKYPEIYSLNPEKEDTQKNGKAKKKKGKKTYYDYFLYVKHVWATIVGNDHKDDCSLDRFDAALWTLGNKVYHFTDPDSEK